MNTKNVKKAPSREEFADYIVGLVQSHPHGHHHHGGGSIETVREDDYEGHHIVIRTTYKIEVNGKVLPVPLGIDNDGNLHCHSLPNYQFSSAVEMIRRLIDYFPEDFTSKKGAGKHPKGHSPKNPPNHEDNQLTHKPTKKGGKKK